MIKSQMAGMKLTFSNRIFTILLLVATLINSSCSFNALKKSESQSLSIAKTDFPEALVGKIEKEFRKINSNLKSTVSTTTTDQALKSLINGTVDVYIGTLDIPLNLSSQIKKVLIAKDGLVVVTNTANPVNNLSKAQVQSIFAGKISNWRQVGGENKPVMIVHEAPSSIERQAFEKLIFKGDAPLANFVTVDNKDEVKETIGGFTNAISYINYSSLDKSLKALSFNNIPATSSNIAQGYFPLVKRVYLYFNSELLQNGKYKSFKELANLLHSPKGQGLIESFGILKLSEAELQIASLNKEPIKVAVSAPQQGSYIDLGRSIINGAKLAVEKINAAGGIEGRPVDLMVCDDKSTPDGAVECASKFAKQGVLGVIGHLNSQASIEASKIYVKNKMVQITPASTHPWYTQRPGSTGFAFRTSGRDDQQAKLIAKKIFGLAKPHPLKISIINNGTVYGSTLSALLEDEILQGGVDKVVENKAVAREQQQYFNDIKDIESDVIVFIGEYGDAATIVKALALNNRSDITFIGSDGTFSEQFIEEAGLRAEGAYIIGNAIDFTKKSIALTEFAEAYEKKFKMLPNSFSMNSYDATMIILDAVKRVKVKHPVLVAKEVADINYHGITGVISFDDIGDPILPRMALYQVKAGKFQRD